MNELELKTKFSNKEYFEKLKSQIEKDFALVGLSSYFEKVNDLTSLHSKLKEDLHFFSINNPSALMQLFYSVDINELKFNQPTSNIKENYYSNLSWEFILREAQKIIFRAHYSG